MNQNIHVFFDRFKNFRLTPHVLEQQRWCALCALCHNTAKQRMLILKEIVVQIIKIVSLSIVLGISHNENWENDNTNTEMIEEFYFMRGRVHFLSLSLLFYLFLVRVLESDLKDYENEGERW